MNLYKTIIITIVLSTIANPMLAQYDTQLSQYWAMPSYYNPAATGTTELLNVTAATRQQWIGMPGAASDFIVIGDMPFSLFKQNHGVGLVLRSETIGLFQNTSLAAQYSFKIKLKSGALHLGLQVGFINQAFDGSGAYIPTSDYHNQSDTAIPSDELQGMGFDMGFGAHYTHKYFNVGIAAQHLTSPSVTFDESYETYVVPAYYFISVGNIPFNNALYRVQPSVMLSTTFQTIQFEFGAILKYNNFLWGGVSYRLNDAVIISIGGEWKGAKLGYSYDYSTSDIVSANSGSHEIFVGYSMKLDLGKKSKNKHKSIRIL